MLIALMMIIYPTVHFKAILCQTLQIVDLYMATHIKFLTKLIYNSLIQALDPIKFLITQRFVVKTILFLSNLKGIGSIKVPILLAQIIWNYCHIGSLVKIKKLGRFISLDRIPQLPRNLAIRQKQNHLKT